MRPVGHNNSGDLGRELDNEDYKCVEYRHHRDIRIDERLRHHRTVARESDAI